MRILFVFFLSWMGHLSFSQNDVLKMGQKIPAFSVSSINNTVLDSKSLAGKVVVINFFATWCGPCRAELPLLESKVWKKYQHDDRFALLVIGRDHTVEELIAFQKATHFSFPMYADKGKLVYNLFADKYIPRTYIIDTKGQVVYMSQGYSEQDFEEMQKILSELLK